MKSPLRRIRTPQSGSCRAQERPDCQSRCRQPLAGGWSRVADRAGCRAVGAFTLLEVMIAGGILFLCLFAILGLLATTLRNARSLQRTPVDAGILAAQLSLTNKLAEGVDSGDFQDLYPGYQWKSDTYEVSTNGLYEVDFTVYPRSGQQGGESHMSILLFRPDSVRARP